MGENRPNPTAPKKRYEAWKQPRSFAVGSTQWVCEPGKEPWQCVIAGTAPNGRDLLVTRPGDPPNKAYSVPQSLVWATKPEVIMPAPAQSANKPASAGPCRQFLKIPSNALIFGCGNLQFLPNPNAGLGDATKSKKEPIRLFVRSSKPIDHFYWGQCVHDMTGLEHKQKIPLDYMHGDDVVGYADKFDVDKEGLTIGGFLTPSRDDDRAAEILYKAKAGVPWEGSVNFDGGNLKIEQLKQGQTAQVNGYTMQGPGTIFRKWTLRGAAVCPYGADPDTQAKFAAGKVGEMMVEVLDGPKDPAPAPSTPQASKPAMAKQFRSWRIGGRYWVCEPGKEAWESILGSVTANNTAVVNTCSGGPTQTRTVPLNWLSESKPGA
ncbi:MAG: hypothetical protein ACLQNE_20340 [Thermoguttaceae bacterium]